MDCSLPGSSVQGIFQAIVLERIAISFSSSSSRPRNGTRVSRIVGRRFTVWATKAPTVKGQQMGKRNAIFFIIYTKNFTFRGKDTVF